MIAIIILTVILTIVSFVFDKKKTIKGGIGLVRDLSVNSHTASGMIAQSRH